MSGKIMEFMTVKEMEEALKETQAVILPVGGTEQHGHHLPLSTDVITAYELAKEVSKLTGCLVAQPVNYSFSGGGLLGTTDIPPALTRQLVIEIGQSLIREGCRNIVILAGHRGSENIQALDEAADLLLRRNREIQVAVVPIWRLSDTWKKAFEDKDFHAGYIETSLLLYLKPELVRDKFTVDPPEAKEIQDQNAWQQKKEAADQLQEFLKERVSWDPEIEVGVFGDPFRSSKELGEKVFKECVNTLTNFVRKLEGK